MTHRHRLLSDVRALDDLLGGGLEEGTSTLIVGAAGTGKSTLAAQFAPAAAGRGQRAALVVCDESPATLITRCTGSASGWRRRSWQDASACSRSIPRS